MGYRIAADAVLVVHLLFIVFVLAGGLLVMRWRWLALLHLPAVIWGTLVELNGWLCPLTPLEWQLRRAAGDSGFSGGFIEHYLVPVIYPAGLTPGVQQLLAALVVAVNVAVYGWLLVAALRRRRRSPDTRQ